MPQEWKTQMERRFESVGRRNTRQHDFPIFASTSRCSQLPEIPRVAKVATSARAAKDGVAARARETRGVARIPRVQNSGCRECCEGCEGCQGWEGRQGCVLARGPRVCGGSKSRQGREDCQGCWHPSQTSQPWQPLRPVCECVSTSMAVRGVVNIAIFCVRG